MPPLELSLEGALVELERERVTGPCYPVMQRRLRIAGCRGMVRDSLMSFSKAWAQICQSHKPSGDGTVRQPRFSMVFAVPRKNLSGRLTQDLDPDALVRRCRLKPVEPRVASARIQRLLINHDELLSNFALNFNLCRYVPANSGEEKTLAGPGKISPATSSTCLSNPRFLSHIASYDLARNILSVPRSWRVSPSPRARSRSTGSA
jgi:hypothetical protein